MTYYADPILIIDRDKAPVVLEGWLAPIKGRIGLNRLFKTLRRQNFSHSQLEGDPQVQILSENVAIATGQATRWSQSGEILEQFHYSYTFRKQDQNWRIIVGLIY